MSLSGLRAGFFGPGNVGKSALIKVLISELEKRGLRALVVDTDLHNSLSLDMEASEELVPWSGKQARLSLKTRVCDHYGFESWRQAALMDSPPRLTLKDLPAHLIQETTWGAIARVYPLEAEPDPGCDHARLNPMETVLSLLTLPKEWVMLVDHPGGERPLSWAWGALALNCAVLVYQPENSKHERELQLLEGYCRIYDLWSVRFPVGDESAQIRGGVMEIHNEVLTRLLESLEARTGTEQDRFVRNSQFELR